MAFIFQKDLIFSEKQQQVLHLLESESNQNVTEILYGGAAGGGKSFLGNHWQIARRLQYPGTRGLIGRSVLKNLKLTTFKTFQDVWENYYKDNPNGITWNLNEKYNVIYFSNGSEILLKDLFAYPSDPNFDSLGSLEISDAFIDELPEIKSKAFEIVQSRIRYKLDVVGSPKTLATGNPSNNWVKYRYVRTKEGGLPILQDHQRFIKATVYDNPDKNFRDNYIKQLTKLNPIDRERLLHGNWDVVDNDNPFFYSFNPQKHNKLYEYIINPNFLLDISFDFNVNPTTALIGQYDTHNNSAHIFDLITANYDTIKGVSPLEACCQLIYNKYIITGLVQPYRLRITGDASGKSGSADKIKSINFYSTISKSLKIRESQIFIRKINLQHQVSSSICNYVFRVIRENHFNIHYLSELINDINLSFKDDKGTLNEAKAKNGLHYVDAMRYLIDFWYSNKFDTNVDRITNYIDGIAKRIK